MKNPMMIVTIVSRTAPASPAKAAMLAKRIAIGTACCDPEEGKKVISRRVECFGHWKWGWETLDSEIFLWDRATYECWVCNLGSRVSNSSCRNARHRLRPQLAELRLWLVRGRMFRRFLITYHESEHVCLVHRWVHIWVESEWKIL